MPERTCQYCEVVFEPTDKRQIYCAKACNRKASYHRRIAASPLPLSDEFRCAECDQFVPAKGRTGPQAKYCSRSCGSRAAYKRGIAVGTIRRDPAPPRPTRSCAQCGCDFVAAQERSRFCSKACTRRHEKAAETRVCSIPECEGRLSAKGLCASHYKAQSPTAASWSRGRPETRRANLRRKTQLRRARMMGDTTAESIDRDEIAIRDGWTCGLCFRRVNKDLVWPHPKSASLDHIEPLSLGGKHVRSNVQIAHLDCNVAKGNRGGGEQLLLIG